MLPSLVGPLFKIKKNDFWGDVVGEIFAVEHSIWDQDHHLSRLSDTIWLWHSQFAMERSTILKFGKPR